ncbi:RND family efflux transporter, MFP subunit [Rhizobium sp. NFR07]|uniref:efflux RND transporter periplasmic adaptor subunit n=1 Tax=Rhizobium sp. NFR07 TaxID=1566262 RepID=UPI0008E821DC|nr:efflux RND transporter periplasmic adaptor subunit [Rhizobium sp. NFR07]SFB32758.1 RND family efflux transporter, MFP subunit [Rhizobium sp. NFR07]
MGGLSLSVLSPARIVAVLFLASAALLWLVPLSASHAKEQMPVTVVVARQGAVTEKIPVVGSLAAREEVDVHPLVQGQAIEKILAEVGQSVQKGQPLAIIDTTEAVMLLDKNAISILRARAAMQVEMSRLDVASVAETQARRVLERSRALQPRGAVSQQVLDEHENAHARALAELGLARQSVALAEADMELVARERREIELTIERSTVRAPEAGLVLRRTARIGAMTSGSAAPLFVIARDAVVEFVAQVTETSFLRLGEGMRAEINLFGYEGSLGGTVRLNAAGLDAATRSGEVRVELDETSGLKPGAFARGTINASARRNILLPGSAVKTAGGRSNILVVRDGVIDLRQVTTGARQDGLVEIVDGVSDGEMVVLKSGGFLKAEDRVRPLVAASGRPAEDHLAAFTLEEREVAR